MMKGDEAETVGAVGGCVTQRVTNLMPGRHWLPAPAAVVAVRTLFWTRPSKDS